MADKILDVVHQSVRNLYNGGIVDGATMKKFDGLCTEPDITKNFQESAAQLDELFESRGITE